MGTTRAGEFSKFGVTVASIMGTFAVFVTFPLGILGIILSCKGLDRIQSNPTSARRFLLWSWILFTPGTLVGTWLFLFQLWRGLVTLLT